MAKKACEESEDDEAKAARRQPRKKPESDREGDAATGNGDG